MRPFPKAVPMDATASALIKHTPRSAQLWPAGTIWPSKVGIIRCGRVAGNSESTVMTWAPLPAASRDKCSGTAIRIFSIPVISLRIRTPLLMASIFDFRTYWLVVINRSRSTPQITIVCIDFSGSVNVLKQGLPGTPARKLPAVSRVGSAIKALNWSSLSSLSSTSIDTAVQALP